MATETLTGIQKAAVLLVQLGRERSAAVLKSLRENEVEEVLAEEVPVVLLTQLRLVHDVAVLTEEGRVQLALLAEQIPQQFLPVQVTHR